MGDYKKERFIRWQRLSIEYLSYSINLFLGMSIAAIGFGLNLLRDDEFIFIGWSKCTFLLSLLALIVSSVLGIACVLNRVKDFRITTAIARKKSKDEDEDELNELEEIAGATGATTRCLFTLQVWSFSIGVLLLIVTMGKIYCERLF